MVDEAYIPKKWFVEDGLCEDELRMLHADVGTVAQKCTGKAKKPVFLFPDKIVKGPWRPEREHQRINRELGRSELMACWSLPEYPSTVLQPSCFAEIPTGDVYLVWPALYPSEQAEKWVFQPVCRNVSAVGPRQLRVVERASTGVIRVSDHVKKQPRYLFEHPECWEHLMHRYVLQAGDSGLHNMLIRPSDRRCIGIDYDENRKDDAHCDDWFEMMFKAKPAKSIMPALLESLQVHREHLRVVLTRLEESCASKECQAIAEAHGLSFQLWGQRVARMKEVFERLPVGE
ncbi:MAG: hypothetical protein CL920_22945 [Deltaproteobacteria bacterium]|nr:hypothetical protein [Deltaproteobacteria bacterium]|tara:strand:+ start:7371 stop:8234 length:864 start_codon:yes stop_codon:yes gene_type:complete